MALFEFGGEIIAPAIVTNVRIEGEHVIVRLDDGRELTEHHDFSYSTPQGRYSELEDLLGL